MSAAATRHLRLVYSASDTDVDVGEDESDLEMDLREILALCLQLPARNPTRIRALQEFAPLRASLRGRTPRKAG